MVRWSGLALVCMGLGGCELLVDNGAPSLLEVDAAVELESGVESPAPDGDDLAAGPDSAADDARRAHDGSVADTAAGEPAPASDSSSPEASADALPPPDGGWADTGPDTGEADSMARDASADSAADRDCAAACTGPLPACRSACAATHTTCVATCGGNPGCDNHCDKAEMSCGDACVSRCVTCIDQAHCTGGAGACGGG